MWGSPEDKLWKVVKHDILRGLTLRDKTQCDKEFLLGEEPLSLWTFWLHLKLLCFTIQWTRRKQISCDSWSLVSKWEIKIRTKFLIVKSENGRCFFLIQEQYTNFYHLHQPSKFKYHEGTRRDPSDFTRLSPSFLSYSVIKWMPFEFKLLPDVS